MTTYRATTPATATRSALASRATSALPWPPPRHTVIALFVSHADAIAAAELARQLHATAATIHRGEALLSAGDGGGTSLPRRLAGFLSDELHLLGGLAAAAAVGTTALVVRVPNDLALARALRECGGFRLLYRAGAWTNELVTPHRP